MNFGIGSSGKRYEYRLSPDAIRNARRLLHPPASSSSISQLRRSSVDSTPALHSGRPSVISVPNLVMRLRLAHEHAAHIVDLSGQNLGHQKLAILANYLAGRTHPYTVTREGRLVTRPPCVWIRVMDLSGNNLGTHGAQMLSEVLVSNQARIDTLNISSNRLGVEGVRRLAVGIINNRTLRTLDLSENFIGNEGVTLLFDALIAGTESGLRRLILNKNNITDVGAHSIGNILAATGLRSLHLAHNKISRVGAIDLGRGLHGATVLRDLNLDGNLIRAEGGLEIGRGLHHCCVLTSLNLTDTLITDEGVATLAEALPSSRLRTLVLHECCLGNAGVTTLAAALPTTSTLEHLVLSSNLITDAGIAALAKSLKLNRSLRSINLAFNDLSDEAISMFEEVLAVNTTLCELGFSHGRCLGGGITTLRARSPPPPSRGSELLAGRTPTGSERRASLSGWSDATTRVHRLLAANLELAEGRRSLVFHMIAAARILLHAQPLEPGPNLAALPPEVLEHILRAMNTSPRLLSDDQVAQILEYAKSFAGAWRYDPDETDFGKDEDEYVLEACGCERGDRGEARSELQARERFLSSIPLI
ncbi:uncharacterized protein VTP21DRAFT_10581 [Calcarisporiella thermophila]|uniref:uncharacterized protein n=1 Tax=Calcarisporiella thermophila TaxID=911321 RepID=UPI0037423797